MSPETERIDIAANVRRLRKSQGLTQVGLAERSGLCQSWVSRLERRAENPSIATLKRLAIGLQVEVRDLLDGQLSGGSPR
ncbi:MAG: helix-turn-helix transcriptional regulator [Chromatiaceae bacterium]|jgi:transcriptional regulator with XRE-family HTH domain